jgi:hypothetical protein
MKPNYRATCSFPIIYVRLSGLVSVNGNVGKFFGAKWRSGQRETVQSLCNLFIEGEGSGTPPPNSQ